MKPKHTEDVRVLNDGLYSRRALSAVGQLFTTHDLKEAVLYQIIMSGSQDKPVYQAAMKDLMRHIRTKCRAEYIGAYEVGEEKAGLHIHAFVLIETLKHFPSDLLSVKEGQHLARLRKRKGISIRIEPPKNAMHGGQMFARLDTPAKLENCINWASYILKPRSKGEVPGRETFFGSTLKANVTKRETQRQKHRSALLKVKPAKAMPAPAEALAAAVAAPEHHTTEQTTNDKGEDMTHTTLTPAGHAYVNGLYEGFVDAGMNTREIMKALAAKGIYRTLQGVIHDLDETYAFYKYAETHLAPVSDGYREQMEARKAYDAIIDRCGYHRSERRKGIANAAAVTV